MANVNREWLRKMRKEKGLTLMEMAKELGISFSFYHEIETGTKSPRVPMAKKIAARLGIEWTIFFEDNEREMQQNTAV